MTTSRLQREYDRLHTPRPGSWRKLTPHEEAELFGDPPHVPQPLPATFWAMLAGLAATLALCIYAVYVQ